MAPDLLNPYLSSPREEVESVLVDSRLDIRLDRFTSPHIESGEKPKKIQLVIIEDTAVMHYRGVTLSPSLKSYKMGLKLSELFPQNGHVLEIGTGTGLIGLSMLNNCAPNVQLTATDIDSQALVVAEIGAQINGVSSQCVFRHGDLYQPLNNELFDLIASNPPFMPSHIAQKPPDPLGFSQELGPKISLDGGYNGLKVYERIMTEADQHLKPGGKFAFRVQPRVAPLVRALSEQALGRRFKGSYVMCENKIKKQSGAQGFMVVIKTH